MKSNILKYVLTSNDLGFTHKVVNGIYTKKTLLEQWAWRVKLAFRIITEVK